MIRGIILAGGSGKRLWPLSTKENPKQFLSFFSKKSFLEESVDRMKLITDSVYVSTGKRLEKKTREVLSGVNLIVEPEMRDTAPAIGLCSLMFDKDDTLVFSPSDAYISNPEKFKENILSAVSIAKKEKGIVVIGIPPRFNSVDFGYIEPAKKNQVVSFREKPSAQKAEEYVKKGFFWNAGIFVCNVGVMLSLFEKHSPEIFSDLMKIKSGGKVDEIYPLMKKISFDFAVMEKAQKVFFVPATFYWNDVGSFDAVSEIIGQKNAVLGGELVEEDSSGNVVFSEKKVFLLGCTDLVVIQKKDVVFVMPKNRKNDLKSLVEEKVSQDLQ